MQTTSSSVGATIREQLGDRALFMLGALNLTSDSGGLMFRIRGSSKVSHIRVHLDPSDTYTVSFFKVRGHNVRTVAVMPGVYADMLHRTIETHTGLYTSL